MISYDICLSLTSLSVTISRPIHVTANGIICSLLWLIFHCIYVPHLLYPFLHWRTFRLLPCNSTALDSALRALSFTHWVTLPCPQEIGSGKVRRPTPGPPVCREQSSGPWVWFRSRDLAVPGHRCWWYGEGHTLWSLLRGRDRKDCSTSLTHSEVEWGTQADEGLFL